MKYKKIINLGFIPIAAIAISPIFVISATEYNPSSSIDTREERKTLKKQFNISFETSPDSLLSRRVFLTTNKNFNPKVEYKFFNLKRTKNAKHSYNHFEGTERNYSSVRLTMGSFGFGDFSYNSILIPPKWYGANEKLSLKEISGNSITNFAPTIKDKKEILDNGDFAQFQWKTPIRINNIEELKNLKNNLEINYFYNENSKISFLSYWQSNNTFNNFLNSIITSLNGKTFINAKINNINARVNFFLNGIDGNYKTLQYTKFRINLSFDLEVNYSETIKTTNELNVYLLNLRNKFQTEFINSNKTISINTDTGRSNGLRTQDGAGEKSNLDYLEEKRLSWWNNQEHKYSANLKYQISSSGGAFPNDRIRFFIEFLDPSSRTWKRFYLDNDLGINFIETDKYRSKLIGLNRIVITPGWYLSLDNAHNTNLVRDVKTRINDTRDNQSRDALGYEWGGKWAYNTGATIDFDTTLIENEILFVNDKKVDVLDKNFHLNLQDLRLQKNEDDKPGPNEYELKIVKYRKGSINDENAEALSEFRMVIIIDSVNPILNVKWFAWDPNNNPEQKKLIEPYEINLETGNVKIDPITGNKIPNKFYDPLIDPATGTKKELLWVDYTGNDNFLPNDTRFLQDPINIDGERITSANNYYWGFIAEGSLSGKGANLTLLSPATQKLRYKVNQNNLNTFELIDDASTSSNKNGTDFSLTGQNENNYFSTSGVWLFSTRTLKGMNGYKLVGIGQNNPQQLFSSNFTHPKIKPLWETTAGKHLASYLNKIKNINDNQIKKLSYEEVLNYWKNYVSDAFSGKLNNEGLSFIIQPNVLTNKVKEYAKTINKEDFNPDQALLNSWIGQFENKDKLSWSANISSDNDNLIEFNFWSNQADDIWRVDSSLSKIYVPIIWKKEWDEFLKNKTNKTIITPKVNVLAIQNITKTLTSSQFFSNPFNYVDQYLDVGLGNEDKVSKWISKMENDNIEITFDINKDFEATHIIDPEARRFVIVKNFLDESFNKKINPFNNILIEQIDLKGLTDKQAIKKYLINEIQKYIDPFYVYNQDWDIADLDAKIDQMIPPQARDTNFLKITNIRLRVLPKGELKNLSGDKYLKVINTIADENTIGKTLDLSNIKIPNLIVSGDDLEAIYKEIFDHVNKQLPKYYQLNKNVEIKDFEASIMLLIVNKPNYVNFEVIGSEQNIINSTTFKVKLIDSNLTTIIDLSKINLKDVDLMERAPQALKSRIIRAVENQLKDFKLEYNKDYNIPDINDLNELVKLVKNKNSINTNSFRIVAISLKASNQTSIKVNNKVGDYSYLDDDKWKKALKDAENNDEEGNLDPDSGSNQSFITKNKLHLLWLIPTVAFGAWLLGLGAYKFFRKFIKSKKIK
ncbi:Mbov_0399 family ICE element protein [Candidatus Mycoplasma pogonae]